jgi:hypothetical protein
MDHPGIDCDAINKLIDDFNGCTNLIIFMQSFIVALPQLNDHFLRNHAGMVPFNPEVVVDGTHD